MRFVPRCLMAVAVAVLTLNLAPAMRVAFAQPYQRALTSETVVVGKVVSIDKEPVEVEEVKGNPKTTYRVALVKIDSPLQGTAGLTHIKVGFTNAPTTQAAPPVRPGFARPTHRIMGSMMPELKEGEEFLFFLSKHPTAGFSVMTPMSPPVEVKSEEGKKQLEVVKKTVAVLANPKAALTAAKPEDRYQAACLMLAKSRQYPRTNDGKVEQQPIDAEINKLILKGLTEGNWDDANRDIPSGANTIGMLGIGPKEGFKMPKVKANQKQGEVYKKAFEEWLQGPGKDYVIKQNVVVK